MIIRCTLACLTFSHVDPFNLTDSFMLSFVRMMDWILCTYDMFPAVANSPCNIDAFVDVMTGEMNSVNYY